VAGRVLRVAKRDALAVQMNLAAAARSQAQEAFEQFGSTGADQARESDDLPGPH